MKQKPEEKKNRRTGNQFASKGDVLRDGRLSGRVATSDLKKWDSRAEKEGVTRTDLIIRVMNNYCQDDSND